VAELADAYGSGPYGATRGGSSPLASNVSFYSAGVWLTSFFSKRPGQQERLYTASNRPIYLPAPFLLAAHRAFINCESRFRPAAVIPPFFLAGVVFVWPFILAQRARAAAASLARVAAGIGRRPPLPVTAVAGEPARIDERRFCRVSICRRTETASCKASIDISIPCHIAVVGGNGNQLLLQTRYSKFSPLL
jgi:hypothetical protein